MDGLCKCLLLSSILAFTSVHAKKVVTIRSATISGVDEARLVIPPRYPNYDEKFSMRVDKTTPTGELEEEEEEPAFEEKYEWSVPAKYLSPGEDLTGSSVTLSFTADNLPPVEIFCTFTMTVKSGAGSVVNSPITAKKAIYLPVWDSGNPISAYLEGTTMTPSSRRAVTMNGTLSLSVSLSSYGEQDRREGATITTPWDSIVHAGGGGYSGGGENGIAAVGGAATADAGEEGESAATGSPYWIASAGSFPEGNVGESVTWKAPDTPSNGVIIQVVVDDLGQKPENEAGSADDGAAEAGRVLVDVVKTSIVRTASWIKVNDDDDDGNGTADMDDTGPVNNENDLRPAFTLTFSPSGIDVGVLTLSDISDTPGRIRVWIGDGTKQRIIDPTDSSIDTPKTWQMNEFYQLINNDEKKVTLYVEGLQPSLETDDVTLELKYAGNGCTTAATASLTVVHLDLDADANYDGQRDIADEHPEDNPGLIVLLNDDDDNDNKTMDKDDADAVEDEDDLQKITLAFAPAALPNATLKLEASAGSDSIKIWAAEDKSGEPLTLPKIYRPAAAPAPEGDDPAPPLPSTLYVEGIAAGDATLKLSFVNDNAIFDEITLHVVKIGLLPDFNRDRKIDDEDQTLLITKGPFRFWVNDDEDDGDVADDDSDIPGGNDPNHEDNIVNGRSDLLDFFPVWINVEKLIEKQPPDLTFQFSLRQDDSALKVVYTTLSPGKAGEFLTAPCTSCGPTLSQSADAATTTEPGASATFPECFVDKLENGNGVVMAEGTATSSSPLVLEIRNGDHIVFARKMPMSLSGVEEMFRWLNLRNCAGGSVNKESSMGVPGNNPDDPEFGKYFIFLHGYSVNEEAARAWNSEVFKRLQQSGSRARYVAVAWYGNESQIWGWIPFAGGKTPDYYSNVEHAFATALPLKNALDNLGNDRVVAAHSLGNVVVSSAIKDHGLSVSTYLMLNAAVAGEAYNGNHDAVNVMRHPDWNGYDSRLWASYWHELFPDTDGRYDLTWKKRFYGVTGINYYSSQEDVLQNGNGSLPDVSVTDPTRAWVNQEMRKGTDLLWIAPGNAEGGWGFDTYYSINDGDTSRIRYPAETTGITNEQLKRNSFFYRFDDSELYTVDGDAFSRQPAIRNRLLADAIPALSHAVGSTDGIGGINLVGFKNGLFEWPKTDGTELWLHSDLKKVAYPLTYNLFDNIIMNGSLK